MVPSQSVRIKSAPQPRPTRGGSVIDAIIDGGSVIDSGIDPARAEASVMFVGVARHSQDDVRSSALRSYLRDLALQRG